MGSVEGEEEGSVVGVERDEIAHSRQPAALHRDRAIALAGLFPKLVGFMLQALLDRAKHIPLLCLGPGSRWPGPYSK